jgi:hexokinase
MWTSYIISREALGALSGVFEQQLQEGLGAWGRQVACLPSQLLRAPTMPVGQAAVLDLGGSNLRSALVTVAPGQPPLVTGLTRCAIRGPALASREAFFDLQARQLAPVLGPGAPLGYCFSYPFEALPGGDARLLSWTKELTVPGVEGELVGDLLRQALGRLGLEAGPITVLNDTVAVLLAGTLSSAPAPGTAQAGLIVGTGTNLAAFFPSALLPKVPAFSGLMAVNLESGNLDPSCVLGPADRTLDGASEKPGRQRFEKAVSGGYLARLLLAELPQAPLAPAEGSAGLWRLVQDEGAPQAQRALARCLLERSADLVAAALLALARTVLPGGGTLEVTAEGGLVEGVPFYGPRLEESYLSMSGSRWKLALGRVSGANLLGSAAAALA